MNQKKIGKFIAELRKEKDLTQEELASKVGITKNAVSKWERGLSLMDVSLMQPVCDILGISIVELLNGEKIKQEDIKSKSESTLKDTITYSKKKIKKSKIKSIMFTTIAIALLLVVVFFGYKFYLLNKYTYPKPDNVKEIVEGLKNPKEVKILKKTIPDNDYLTIENFRIRNDLKDYKFEENIHPKDGPVRIYTYRKELGNDKKSTIQFSIEDEGMDLVSAYSSQLDFYGDGDINAEAFNKADRKFFLLKNDINNEIDFLKYVADNYYKENNIFMDKRTMMENYAFNLFVDIAVPHFKDLTLIKGDYTGFISCVGKNEDGYAYEVSILRDGKIYNIITNDQRFANEDYMIDLISTIEIR